MNAPQIEIVSHPLCPHAQRCRVTLLLKGLEQGTDFEMRYVDLAAVPTWFRVLSPKGQMPVVVIEGTPFFDVSSVAEYFEEALPSRLLPESLTERIRHRDTIRRADALMPLLKEVFTAKTDPALEDAIATLFDRLAVLECEGEHAIRNRLSMIDAAFAPFFSLVLFHSWLRDRDEWSSVPLVRAWGDRLLRDRDVIGSRCDRYGEEFEHFFELTGSALSAHVAPERHQNEQRRSA